MKPSLVRLDGKVCMQLRLGQFTATVPLPEKMSVYTEAELTSFFEQYVPQMQAQLISARNAHNRKIRKKACRSGSTALQPASRERTLKALPPTSSSTSSMSPGPSPWDDLSLTSGQTALSPGPSSLLSVARSATSSPTCSSISDPPSPTSPMPTSSTACASSP